MRRRQALAEDDPAVEFAVLDFNRTACAADRPRLPRRDRHQRRSSSASATYKGVEVMESTQFCGAACHTVMEPEYTTYKRSPHARVKCVECHIGEGANWFVKSKLSGSWQLVSVAFNLYPRPIAVPVHNLRPARETCEQCHWPNKFVGDRFKVNTHFAEDEANTETKTVLRGEGRRPAGGPQPGHPLARRPRPRGALPVGREAPDDLRGRDGGEGRHRRAATRARPPTRRRRQAATEWRTMDCVDCHNRPTHVYREPDARARRRAPRPADRPVAAVRAPRGPEGAAGRVPEPRGGARRDREGDRRLLRGSATRRWRRRRRTRSRRRARRSATSGPGTCSPR